MTTMISGSFNVTRMTPTPTVAWARSPNTTSLGASYDLGQHGDGRRGRADQQIGPGVNRQMSWVQVLVWKAGTLTALPHALAVRSQPLPAAQPRR